ncbi:ArsR family transcriptional regulator [Virgibacillus dakarensis]|uniref:Transcriptional regulator n=1 Tax=Lentibacillus populi TaxID=1827502 RepID=A0A9W5X4L0_9BACI|nr:ArsR family transcriptional regulator [Lentibacillus populi]MTW84426.1 ArsR family transcriptional regulator [Virgibacillus dakarensis]GGB32903.1 transcriptional regulator [Lentibacillus populi]
MLELSINKLKELQKVAHALSSDERLNIINLLNTGNMNIHQLATTLKIPVSTAASHVKVLEESGLILTELRPASRGAMKVCTRNFDDIHIQLKASPSQNNDKKVFDLEMPIGQYVDFDVAPTCGMADQENLLIPEDEPVHFFNPVRSRAQLIWTRKGFFEYKFPLIIPPETNVSKVGFSVEICSEAPNHDHNWPSDITIWVNGIDIGTWTSPGDFGDRPGKLNPEYWAESTSTQYGTLKTWKVTNKETTIDDVHLSNVTVDDLNILDRNYLSLRIGIKEDAIHKGGINLFGKKFGDHEQDIKLRVEFSK